MRGPRNRDVARGNAASDSETLENRLIFEHPFGDIPSSATCTLLPASSDNLKECSSCSVLRPSHFRARNFPSLKMSSVLPLCLVLVLVLFSVVDAFNLDTENCIKHQGPSRSMFGFSVAEHIENGASWIIVGAPEAQTNQPGVWRGGAVYRCSVDNDTCQEVYFDRKGNINNGGSQIEEKSNQWFGATVRSSGENGVVMACAPRYVWFTTYMNRRDPVGKCYSSKNLHDDFLEFAPCRTRSWGHHKQGSCQAGLGASVSKDGKRLFIGGVGSWYWQGQLYSIDSNVRLPFIPPRFAPIEIEPGQIFSQDVHDRTVLGTHEGPSTDDDSYLGYSVAVGGFSNDGEPGVAVGMPKGAGLLGKIVLFTQNLENIQNITGEQLGAYFGYSLCVVDVDGDELDDLVIGAPLYTDLTNNEGDYENGRIYVVYQGQDVDKFRVIHTRDGKNSRSRFGLALTSLGDINKDGYGDFAVGAPYDGPFEKGAVYIYHGSHSGVREKPSQIIFAESVLPGHATTFGFSLSGGLDLDRNQYPDLVIGAYEADSAFFLRARPVVKMQSSLQFASDSKQISLEEFNCTLKNRVEVTCLELRACMEYSGIGVDQTLDFDVQLLLDSKKPKSPRMFFLFEEGKNFMNQSIRLDKTSRFCKTMYVYIKSTIRDKLTPLEAEMRYSLRDSYASYSSSTRPSSGRLAPVLDTDDETALVRRDSVSIQKNCGGDNVCIPNLQLNAFSSVERYLLGSGERLYIDVSIQNVGEDSFESTFDMSVPFGMNYVNIERIDNAEKEIPVLCSPPSRLNNNTLHCDIGNPLPKEKMVHFKVILEPFHNEKMKPRYEFLMAVNSTNPEVSVSTSDNFRNLSVPIWVESDIILQGSSHPSDVHYNSTIYNSENITTEADIGPQVIHIYNIRNKGPSDVLEAEAFFLWPSYTLDGDHLLYLLEQPETSGPIKCELVDKVNEEEVQLDKKRKSYLELTGIQSNLINSGAAQRSSSRDSNLKIEESQKVSAGASISSSSSLSSSGSFNTRPQNVRPTMSEKNGRKKYEEKKKFEESSFESESSSSRAAAQGRISSSSRGETSQSNNRQNSEKVHHNVRIPVETSVANRNNYAASTSKQSGGQFNVQTNEGGYHVQEAVSSGGFSQPAGIERNFENVYSNRSSSSAYDARRAGANSQSFETNVNRGSAADSNFESGHASGNFGFNINNGGKDHSTFHSVERNYNANTTWDSASGGQPRTVEHSSWRTNDDDVVRNGSKTRTYAGHPSVDFSVDSQSSLGSITRTSPGENYLDSDFSNSHISKAGQHYSSSVSGNHYYAGGDNVEPPKGRTQGGIHLSETSEHSVSENTRVYNANEDNVWNNVERGRDKIDEERRNRANQAAKQKNNESERQRQEDKKKKQEVDRRKQEEAEKHRLLEIERRKTEEFEHQKRLELQRREEIERRRNEETERRENEEIERRKNEETERRRNEEYERRYESESRSQEMRQRSRTSYQSSSKESEDSNTGRLKLYTRYRREIDVNNDETLEELLKCGPTKCTKIKCSIGRLSKDQEGWIAFRSRIWMPTIKKIAGDKEVHLSSMLAVQVTKLPHIDVPDVPLIRSLEINTQVLSRDSGIEPEMVPLWVVILSAVLGALILMLLIYLLYKCGFFERNRPNNIPEKQPLNRNGIYQTGDEAL